MKYRCRKCNISGDFITIDKYKGQKIVVVLSENKSHKVYRDLFSMAGVNSEDLWIVPLLRCRSGEDVDAIDIVTCAERYIEDVIKDKAKIVVASGKLSVKYFTGFPDIYTARQKRFFKPIENSYFVIPTHQIEMDRNIIREIVEDFELINKMLRII